MKIAGPTFVLFICFTIAAARQPSIPDSTAVAVLPAPSPDPWVMQEGSEYFFSQSWGNGIAIRRTANPLELSATAPVVVWRAPGAGPFSREVWAPEIHRLDGRWFIYFAADSGRNEDHRMWVIESSTDSPLGPYETPRRMDTQGWAIDGTVLTMPDSSRYFVWSGWKGKKDGRQDLYIARMRSPVELDTPRTLLTVPDEPWEKIALPLCEGPEAIVHDGRVFIVYSASASWTADYCLGMLEYVGGDVLRSDSWKKSGPVFASTGNVFGVGHCSFVQSPSGAEDWIFYHAKSERRPGWGDRSTRAQKFRWGSDGRPVFGTPFAPVTKRNDAH